MSGANANHSNHHMEFLPEGIQIDISASDNNKELKYSIMLPIPPLDKEFEASLVQRLQDQPLKLAALLEVGASGIVDLLPRRLPWGLITTGGEMPSGGKCSCGELSCNHKIEALKYADNMWEKQPDLRLRMLGITRDGLLAAVLDNWAAIEPLENAEEALLRYVGNHPEEQSRAQGSGPNIAEWLAEVAEMGRLHQPGPQFHDVQIHLDPVDESQGPVASPVPWKQLLPHVFSASKGYSLISSGVMQRAEKLAASLRKLPQE